jgi:hypothetical protein
VNASRQRTPALWLFAWSTATLLFLAVLLAGCGARTTRLGPEHPYWQDADRRAVADPGKREPSLLWQTADRTSFEQTDQLLDIDRSLRKISGHPKQSYNHNSFDEVPNSAWYTNRHHLVPMSAEELRRGPMRSDGPDKSGPWAVFRPKIGGVTAGFWIKDARGDQYILKFDPPGHPELATSAAVMAGRFFYAVGYNVPQETITSFALDDLVIQDGVTWKDVDGAVRPFDRAKLEDILTLAHRNADGTYRSVASRALPNIRGPFSFDSRRKNDPNDWCDHEHRRELRALYVFCSLINHWDMKDENTMDVFVGEDGQGHLAHYLLDFGSTFGSSGRGAQRVTSGYANTFDLLDALVSFGALGLKKWQWEDARPYQHPSVGYFESDIFHPAKWDPIYPNPAFENMTNRDAYWAAKIVMSFSADDLRTIIEAGQLSDAAAREYLFLTLRARQDKIGRHWFAKVNPLDRFEISPDNGGLLLAFRDYGLEHGFCASAVSSMQVRYRGRPVLDRLTTTTTEFRLQPTQVQRLASVHQPGADADHNLYECRVITVRDGHSNGKAVVVWLWYHADRNEFQLVGVEHLD